VTSDLAYLEAWGLAAAKRSLPWPAPEALVLKFVAHHLWDPEKQAADPSHGMQVEVNDKLRKQSFLKAIDPHAPVTVSRRLANWSTLMNGAALMVHLPSLPSNRPFAT
jgi:hypothetical protein